MEGVGNFNFMFLSLSLWVLGTLTNMVTANPSLLIALSTKERETETTVPQYKVMQEKKRNRIQVMYFRIRIVK